MITLILRRARSISISGKHFNRTFASTTLSAIEQDEYTDVPQYPEIEDMSVDAKIWRKKLIEYDRCRQVKSVEEKLIRINMPFYYGWRTIPIHEDIVPFNALEFAQHCTRTHLVINNSLPEHYLSSQMAAESIVAQIKDEIQDCLVFEQDVKNKRNYENLSSERKLEEQTEDENTLNIVTQLNRIISNKLAESVPYISSMQVDVKPRHESFWFVGGMPPPHSVRNKKLRHPFWKHRADRPVNRPIQFLGKTLLSIRNSVPLEPFIPYEDAVNSDYTVPKYVYSPETAGYHKAYRYGTNIPGFWPGDTDEFGSISFHGRGYILNRWDSFGEEDHLKALHCQAMFSSFGWLTSQACYQGFTPYNDITYPLVTQTVITNGRLWSFYAYQMNTLQLYEDYINTNPLKNFCYGTKPLKLYESIEDGKVVGFNDDVLKILLQFYLNEPKERLNTVMKPYLGDDEKVIADIEDSNRRVWVENLFKYMVSNRPKHRLAEEIYAWEKIYKIDHKTRIAEGGKRFFEKHEEPFKRTMYEVFPGYIPKCVRPGGPKSKDKIKKEYWDFIRLGHGKEWRPKLWVN